MKAGELIQKELSDLLNKCTPYVRTEATIACRFDMVAYIPEGRMFPIDQNKEFYTHCYHKFRRKYCYKKKEELLKKAEAVFPKDPPKMYYYMFEDRRYESLDGLWLSIKDRCICNPQDCQELKEYHERWANNRKEHGFMEGLHVFEIKSDKDDFSRLTSQIPNMLLIADYAWLVLGQYQAIPIWLPPYVGVIRYYNSDKHFEIERASQVNPKYPAMHKQVLQDHDYDMKAKDKIKFMEALFKKWCINSIFRWKHEGQIIIDMTYELKELQSLAKEVKEKTPEEFQKEIIKTLNDEWEAKKEKSG